MRVRVALLAMTLAAAVGPAVLAPAGGVAAAREPSPGRAAAQAAAPVAHLPGTYVPVRPFRAPATTKAKVIGAGRAVGIAVGGHGSVPARNVSAVVVTLTAVSPPSRGGLVAFAGGTRRPAIMNLLYQPHTTISVTTVARVSSGGVLAVYNSAASGRTGVIVDVSGYYVGGTVGNSAGALHPLTLPMRAVGTSTRGVLVGANRATTVNLGGRFGVPRSGVGAVLVAISAVNPSAAGGLAAYSPGNDRPVALAARFVAHQNRASFAVVPTSDSGSITLANVSHGSTQIVVDLIGWTSAGPAAAAGALQTRYPNRLITNRAVAAGRTTTTSVLGRGGVPLSKVAAILALITVTAPTGAGGITAYGDGTAPGVTDLQFTARTVTSNLAYIPVDKDGMVSLTNRSPGRATVYLDLVGYVPSTAVTAPAASTSRYIRTEDELVHRFGDPTDAGEGCFDAAHGSTFVLLQFGAQLNNKSGVQLTGSTQDQVSYAELVTGVNGYLASLVGPQCATPAHVTVALGTNNSGDFTTKSHYSATDRGTDWANKVVDAVTAPAGITVVGANDIEQLFDGTYQNGLDWETAYLTASPHNLIFNGSADGCETAYGNPGQKCAYWTMAQLYTLAGGLSARITALPQIYTAGMAAQWTNIYATGDAHSRKRAGFFAGALTQSQVCQGSSEAVCAATYTPQQGWTALYRGLSTVVAAPSLPVVTDLRADG